LACQRRTLSLIPFFGKSTAISMFMMRAIKTLFRHFPPLLRQSKRLKRVNDEVRKLWFTLQKNLSSEIKKTLCHGLSARVIKLTVSPCRNWRLISIDWLVLSPIKAFKSHLEPSSLTFTPAIY